mgnify:CR=1 FL=1
MSQSILIRQRVSHIAETAAIASDICRYVENQAAAIGKSIIQWNGEAECLTAEIDAAAFVGQDIAIQRELLRQVLERTAGQLKDIRSVHIGTLRHCFTGMQEKRQICLRPSCGTHLSDSERLTEKDT